MYSTAAARPTLTIRWLVAFTNLAICVRLAGAAIHPASTDVQTIHTLSLIAIALCAYAWVVLPTIGGAVVSLSVLIALTWVWAVHTATALGVAIAALLILMSVAAMQQRRRARRFQRLELILDDLSEERTVKDQAIASANQNRDALQKKLSRYAQLQSIAEALSTMTDLESIAQLAVDRAFTLIGKSDVCLLFLIDRERQELSLFASKKTGSLGTIRAKHGDQFDRYVLRTHRPLFVNDVRRDFRFTVTPSSDRSISSVIACPLLLGQSPEGVLRLDSAQSNAYTQDDLRFLDILLDLVSTAVTNAKLFAQTQQLAMTDGLTGLALRRPWLDQLAREIVRSGRSREPVSVIMLDVDHFKAYNDTFGHSAGDVILRAVADVLRHVVPPGGVIARYGGEEFVVLLPRVGRQRASEIAERIRTAVEQQVPFGERHAVRSGQGEEQRRVSQLQATQVTVSLGVAAFPDDAQADLELIRVADERLYAAKHAGRNLVCSS